TGGRKRRLNLAAGLLHDPDILLLDEPTVGVDPQSRNAIFENLETLKRRGKALLYTTHYMEEVERLADRIVVMDHGKVIAEDTLEGLRSRPSPCPEASARRSKRYSSRSLEGACATDGCHPASGDGPQGSAALLHRPPVGDRQLRGADRDRVIFRAALWRPGPARTAPARRGHRGPGSLRDLEKDARGR